MIVPVELVLPVIPLTAGVFDTQVLKHVMLAGPIVKLVLLLLIGFSVISWAIIFLKFRLFKGIERNQGGFARAFAEGKSLTALYEQAEKGEKSPLTEVYRAGYLELTRIQRERGEAPQGGRTAPFPVENVYRAMNRTTYEQVDGMENLLPFLATTGSATPFIGLFGTVWGIMNAFSGIATTGNATLATVAPGIAEALVATAAGLAAAIPSVMAYNYFLSRIRAIHTRINSFTSEFINFLERKVDKG
ncbi:MAG TPA: protein TolQ [Desulfobacteria bacterium]|nr:protein TolQ [Desulfobacteria bacterium]